MIHALCLATKLSYDYVNARRVFHEDKSTVSLQLLKANCTNSAASQPHDCVRVSKQ